MTRWLILVFISVAFSLGAVVVGFNLSDNSTGVADPNTQKKIILSLGYDLSNPKIDLNTVLPGGVAKNAIKAIQAPEYLDANDEAAAINEEWDRVIGVVVDGEARAYPLRILNYHEIVNTGTESQKYSVTYCPLCDSAAVFNRQTEIGEINFAVSGLLYNSNVLMYNMQKSESDPEFLWSQIRGQAIGGAAGDIKLEALPVEMTTWGEWKKQHPETKVLTFKNPYTTNPYRRYFQTQQLQRPVWPLDVRLPLKTPVLGVQGDKTRRAYQVKPFAEGQNRLEDVIDGKKIVLEYLPESNSMRVVESEEGLSWMYSFWFAWASMYTDTELYLGDVKEAVIGSDEALEEHVDAQEATKTN